MSLVINTNIASLTAQQNLNTSQSSLQTSLQRLSSGLRINSAADDPAGLAIADRFTTQINGLNQASQNANDAISLAQTAGGALQQVTNNLQTIRQLAVESANSTNSASDRQALDQQVQQDIAEINRIATQTSFNNQNVLDGTFGHAVFQVGANVGQTIGVDLSTSTKTNSIGSFVNTSSNVATNSTGFVQTGSVAAAVAKTYTGVSGTAPDGSNSFTITPNGGTATAIANSAGFSGTLPGQGASSAYAVAAAVNGSGISGVTASATNSVDLGTDGTANQFLNIVGATGGTSTYSLSLNGTVVYSSGAQSGNFTASVNSVITSINQQSSITGVTASADSNGGLQLSAADGRDIAVSESVVGTGTATAAGSVTSALSATTVAAAAEVAGGNGNSSLTATYRGQVTLQSGSTLTLSANAQAALGYSSGILQAGSSLAQQSVGTVAGANATILSVDSALTAIDSLQATFGAIQNRFDSAIASLGTAVTNLSSARSQVQDANFASETSNLTRAQILQQAGVSILAQANALPQGVLKLLQ